MAAYTYKQRKKMIRDRQRPFRIVESFEFHGIFEHSPIEVIDGFVISDKNTNELFFTFSFKNVSQKSISALNIRIHLFDKANIPYLKLPFTYSYDLRTLGVRRKSLQDNKNLLYNIKNESKFIEDGETFGTYSYIAIPESYFKKIKLELESVVYADGSVETLELLVSDNYKLIKELDEDVIFSYANINIYDKEESTHPAIIIPKRNENVWLCCCGHKNPISFVACEKCMREQDWQFKTINEDNLKDVTDQLRRVNALHYSEKVKYSQLKYLETQAERDKKVEAYQKAMENIAQRERKKERLKLAFIPKVALAVMLLTLLFYLLQYLVQFIRR